MINLENDFIVIDNQMVEAIILRKAPNQDALYAKLVETIKTSDRPDKDIVIAALMDKDKRRSMAVSLMAENNQPKPKFTNQSVPQTDTPAMVRELSEGKYILVRQPLNQREVEMLSENKVYLKPEEQQPGLIIQELTDGKIVGIRGKPAKLLQKDMMDNILIAQLNEILKDEKDGNNDK
jgi:hypothetical protein